MQINGGNSLEPLINFLKYEKINEIEMTRLTSENEVRFGASRPGQRTKMQSGADKTQSNGNLPGRWLDRKRAD